MTTPREPYLDDGGRIVIQDPHVAEFTTAEPVSPWPDWLEGLTAEQRVHAIVNAVANCYSAEVCDHADGGEVHLQVVQAAPLLLRLLNEARAEPAAVPSAEQAQLAVAVAALRRLALAEPMTETGDSGIGSLALDYRDRLKYAAGTLETIARLEVERPEPEPVCDSRNENPITSEPKPPVRLANVEVKGFRDLGVVAVSEITLAGVPFLHAESRDGSSADFPASSVHFIAWLPPGSPWPEKPKAITSRDLGFSDRDDDAWNPDLHIPACQDETCAGGCMDRTPF